MNILVYAHRVDAPNHEAYRAWLDLARRGPEPLGIPSVVSSGFVRIVTHPRIFGVPSPIGKALDFVGALHSADTVERLDPGPRHWAIVDDLARRIGAKGNQVPDVYLGAIAIEHGATWVSADRGFAGYPGLRWAHPLDAA